MISVAWFIEITSKRHYKFGTTALRILAGFIYQAHVFRILQFPLPDIILVWLRADQFMALITSKSYRHKLWSKRRSAPRWGGGQRLPERRDSHMRTQTKSAIPTEAYSLPLSHYTQVPSYSIDLTREKGALIRKGGL